MGAKRTGALIDRIGGGLLIAMLLAGAAFGLTLFGGGRATFLLFGVVPLGLAWLVWDKLISRGDDADDTAR